MVFHSSFRGHTAQLASSIVEGARRVPEVDVAAMRVEEVDQNWDLLHRADAIVFGSPTYIGSVSSEFKKFVERLAGEIWLKRRWANKLAAGFPVSGGLSGDKLACLSQMTIFAAQMGMIWVNVPYLRTRTSEGGAELCLNRMSGYLGLMAQADALKEAGEAIPRDDHATAEYFGEHIAMVARQFALGRSQAPALPFGTNRVEQLELEGSPKSLFELDANPDRPGFRS